MSAYRPWVLLSLIFILGVGTGVALALGIGPHFHHPPGEQQLKNRWMVHLIHRLDLTNDQQQKIQPILTEAENQIHLLHQEEIGRMSNIIESTNARISPLLTSDQQAELKKMANERPHGFPGHEHPPRPPGAPLDPPRPDEPPPQT